jgi:hypothetical protein
VRIEGESKRLFAGTTEAATWAAIGSRLWGSEFRNGTHDRVGFPRSGIDSTMMRDDTSTKEFNQRWDAQLGPSFCSEQHDLTVANG